MNRATFALHFAEALANLQGAEQTTRRELQHLSRELLVAIHGLKDATLTGDIQFINQLLTVLTPVNRKVAVLFFAHFAGFHYAEGEKCFTKKSAKRGVPARADAIKALEDPNFNIWSWADRHIDVEPKPFDQKKVTQYIESQIKKAAGSGKTRLDVLRAVFAGGFDVKDVIALMDELDVKADEQPAPADKPAEPAPF